jgi:hypothetical protein
MATQAQTSTASARDTVTDMINKVRELYADAPEVGRIGLEKMVAELKAAAAESQQRAASAGRTGLRQGKVSELTSIVTFAPGGAKRLRALLKVLGGNFQGADKVGTLHDMRFVFLDNDTRLLFATTYDGDWDTYIDDFSTKIPDALDVFQQYGGISAERNARPRNQRLDRGQPDHGRRLVCRFAESHRPRGEKARKAR